MLSERYQLIEKRLPVFAAQKARRSRYYLTDNFLRAWLAALAGPVAAVSFRPVDQPVADADQRLRDVEGRAFEKLVGVLYEERSRKGIGDFPLSERINGYWDRSGTEIDLVALNAPDRVIRRAPASARQRNWSATYPPFAATSSASCASFPNTPAGGSNVCRWRRTCFRMFGKKSSGRGRSCKISTT